MDPKSEEKLKSILAKEPFELTSDDKGFLKARIHYVGKKSRAKFADVFNEVPEEPKQEKSAEAQETENEKKTEGEITEEAATTESSPFETEMVDIKDDTEDEDEDDIVE